MSMTNIKVDDVHYAIPTQVSDRMGEYYTAMKQALADHAKLLEMVKEVRRLQVAYFKTRDSVVLRKCKAAERILDDLLEGKKDKKAEQIQAQLFR